MDSKDSLGQFRFSDNRGQFDENVAKTRQVMHCWFKGDRSSTPDLSELDFPVYLKNRERTITLANESFRDLFARDEWPIGKHSDSFLHESIASVSQQTDQLILNGYSSIQLDHLGEGPEAQQLIMRTYKQSLEEYDYEPYQILGVSCPIELVVGTENKRSDLKQQYKVYLSLSEQDRKICKLYGVGETTRFISLQIGLSTKAIENHRRKIMKSLGLEKPIEIVKLLVRFEERGYLDVDQF